MEPVKFIHPFTMLVAGPTGSGKTIFTRDLLRDYRKLTNINKQQLNVLWNYGVWQRLYNEKIDNVSIVYHEGLADLNFLQTKHPDIIVIDDLMSEAANEEDLMNLFTKGSHHMNISVIFIVQNAFFQSKQMRSISLNSHYIILMKSPRDKQQIARLGQQVFPGKGKMFMAAYDDATNHPFSNFIVDLHPRTNDSLRLRSIVKDEGRKKLVTYKLK